MLENLEKFGALKAIGATRKELVYIIIFQAVLVGFIGYGIGVLLASAMIGLGHLRIPNFAAMLGYGNMLGALAMVIIIVAFASFLGVRKVLRVEAFEVFRG